jgi:hypothetical protein
MPLQARHPSPIFLEPAMARGPESANRGSDAGSDVKAEHGAAYRPTFDFNKLCVTRSSRSTHTGIPKRTLDDFVAELANPTRKRTPG